MSGGLACRRPEHRPSWRVGVLRANFSAFNGYHRTASAYSGIVCLACGRRWRTKAGYVESLPMLDKVFG